MIATIPPAEIGMTLEEVDTPALLIDMDAFEDNIRKMVELLAPYGLRLRPHAKTHKSSVIALQQIAQGAVGICCQKVGEAEAMVCGGVKDVFVSNEIVGRAKLDRLVALAKQARIAVCADDSHHVNNYADAASAGGIVLDVFVELNVGADRCGVESGQAALALAQDISRRPSLRFAGLQAYHGKAQHLRTPAERREAIRSAVEKVRECRALLAAAGFSCETITGAGTGTYPLEAASGIYDEIQAGSYIFMDVDYAKNRGENGRPLKNFQHSLFVYTTVMSHAVKDRAVVDAGLKAVAVDCGLPAVFGMDDVTYVSASDEHGKLAITSNSRAIHIGEKIKLIPGHCDPTVNLFDWYVGIRCNRVEALWPISARGASR